VLSTATTSALPPGISRCNTAGALVADETAARSLSANKARAGISGASVGRPLDFCAVV
jgi:hypothetical protein